MKSSSGLRQFCALSVVLAGCFSAPPPVEPVAKAEPAFSASPEDLARVVSRSTEGFGSEGAPLDGKLDAFQPLSFTLKRGECYVLVLHLAEGAEFSEHAKRGVDFTFKHAGGISDNDLSSGPGVVGPGGVATIGCPQHDSVAQFDMRATWNVYRDPSHAHDLGRGGYRAQLYSKQTSDQELAAERQAYDKDQREQRASAAHTQDQIEEKRHAACVTCLRAHDTCIADWRRAAPREKCDEERDSCLFLKGGGEHVADCAR